ADGVPAKLADDVARVGGVLGEVHLPSNGLEALGELAGQLGQVVEVRATSLLEIRASLREVEALKRGVAPGPQAGHRMGQRLLKLGVVEGAIDAPREVAP